MSNTKSFKSLTGEIPFLRQKLGEKNVPTKFICIVSIANGKEFLNFFSSLEPKHNKFYSVKILNL